MNYNLHDDYYYYVKAIRLRPLAVRDEGSNKNWQRSKFLSTFMCDYKFWVPQSEGHRPLR